ncbi:MULTISPECIES: DUF2935 domain-containing protein [Caproicibacterium]|uniref:DUF2935 domain-containing protein n=1 Tax=Caproicibacterium argilliputei TaxID=3030016 RepID=A0AA97H2X3_9FIRM|nr:DUF2935 domain-containing protein [Caproicibacterium argilliputei]WOC33195.1 DUF2935 domain-containing protein [Caproicibacterium argilliputei]
MNSEEYVRASVETSLFWTRIMKEHAIFIISSLPPVERQLAAQGEMYRRRFTNFFREFLLLANGVVPEAMLASEQFCTAYTEQIERLFQRQIGVETNSALTVLECHLMPAGSGTVLHPQLQARVAALNKRIQPQLDAFIAYQTAMLQQRAQCRLYFSLYPSALNHLMNEAKRYREELNFLQSCGDTKPGSYIAFWNQGMSEHAKSLRGELDWVEVKSMDTANSFANIYDELAAARPDQKAALEYTRKFQTYAEDVTKHTMDCSLKGVMTALYTDHLLREVNHYRYELQQ